MKHKIKISDKAVEILTEFEQSGQTETIAVADILKSIASNGDGQETDDFLLACAEEIRNAADAFINRLGGEDPWADPTDEMDAWRHDVAQGNTVLGFQDWKAHKRETERDERECFKNYYRHCETEWDDTADSMCNDRCPVCNAEIEPYKSEDI